MKRSASSQWGTLILFSSFSVLSYLTFAGNSQSVDWNPEKVIPQLVHVAPAGDELEKTGEAFRNKLIENMTYWKSLGMPKPDDIEGLIDLSGADNVPVAEILQSINPEIPNVVEHINQQYKVYRSSTLYGIIQRLQKKFDDRQKKKSKGSVKPKDYTEIGFEKFVGIRYNFQLLPNCFEAIKNNWTLQQAKAALKDKDLMMEDNAFFTQIPQVDLGDILVADQGNDTETIWKSFSKSGLKKLDADGLIKKVINLEKFKAAMKNPNFFFQRIFILPRSTQTADTPHLSTLNDTSVGTHELGHEMLDSMKQPGDEAIDRLVHEVMADYFAAAPENNPVVGEYFAKVSAEIVDRLKANGEIDTSTKKLINSMSRLAERGFIRDLSASADIDNLARVYSSSDPYTSGNPIRKALWDLRSSEKENSTEIDTLVLETAMRFVALPKVYSQRTQMVLWARSMYQQFKKMGELAKITAKVQKTPEFAINLEGKSEAEKEEYQEALDYASEVLYGEKFGALEKKEMKSRSSWRLFGVSERPAIAADYIVPEFFRELYRVAQEHSPALAQKVRGLTEKAMNGSSLTFDNGNGNGSRDIVFLRRTSGKLNFIARNKLSDKIKLLASIRGEVQNLRGQTDDTSVEQRTKLMTAYAKELEGLQEYERTASTFKLYKPYFLLGIVQDWLSSRSSSTMSNCIESLSPAVEN